MKKILSGLTIFTLVLIWTTGCSKKSASDLQDDKGPATQSLTSAPPAAFKYYEYGTEITEDDFLRNPKDSKDEKFNYVSHALTLSLLELYKRPDLLKSLISEIDGTRNKQCNLYLFANKHPEINTIFNNVFANRVDNFASYGNNWKSYVQANYKYDTTYIPLARFINNGTIDLSKDAYIAAPNEINEEKFTTFNNNIPLWINSTEGMLFSTIDEQQSYLIDNPVILIANGFEGDDNAIVTKAPSSFDPHGKKGSLYNEVQMQTMSTSGQQNPNDGSYNLPHPMQPQTCIAGSHVHEYLTHINCKVNYAYEGSGDLEYNIVWGFTMGYLPSTSSWYNYVNDNNLQSSELSISQGNVGVLLNFYEDLFAHFKYLTGNLCFDITTMPLSAYCRFGFGAYERDWFNVGKPLFSICVTNGAVVGQRKYDNEWYYFDPATNTSYPFNIRNPNRHTTYYNYNKGELRLHRWN